MTRILLNSAEPDTISAPQQFDCLHRDLLAVGQSRSAPLIIGLDLPIGLPGTYANRVGISDFKAFLRARQGPDWKRFSHVSHSLDHVSLAQPFYPYGRVNHAELNGFLPQQAWLRRLGLEKADVYRQCDIRTPDRTSAASLFWTVGGNQVGKAALSGWEELIRPLITARPDDLGLWPYDGDFQQLCQNKAIVIAETYPGEVYGWFDCKPGSKTKRDSRLLVIPALQQAVTGLRLTMTEAAAVAVADGFGHDRMGEDRFDSFIGALGMYAVYTGRRAAPVPADPVYRQVEGWILGQALA